MRKAVIDEVAMSVRTYDSRTTVEDAWDRAVRELSVSAHHSLNGSQPPWVYDVPETRKMVAIQARS